MSDKPQKRFDKLGYGAFALYLALIGVMALAVYGFKLTSLRMDQSRSERERAEMQTGHLLITTEDRTECRSLRFDNVTSALGRETLIDCDAARIEAGNSSNKH